MLGLLFFIGCLARGTEGTNKVFRNGINMLYGETTTDMLFSEYPNWKQKYTEYSPDSSVADKLTNIYPDLEVYIFLGTWCGDSRKEVPRFLKIADETHFISRENIKMWAVDRNKTLESGLAEKYMIKRVATFIFLKNDKEIGRIVEKPESKNMENDILQILADY